MHKAFTANIEAPPAELFTIVADLSTYPHWLDLVSEVTPADEPDAFWVTLRARIGPLARSKRLRMVRVAHEPVGDGTDGGTVRFERQETDGRDHAQWVLGAIVSPTPTGGAQSVNEAQSVDETQAAAVEMQLSYAGSLWSGLLDGVLDGAAERATNKLSEYVLSADRPG